MAHRIKVKKVPYRKVDGTYSTTKFEYHASCKCRGKVCAQGILTSAAAAQGWSVAHREEMRLRSAAKGNPTPKQKTVRPATRAARAIDRIETERQNRMLANLREM